MNAVMLVFALLMAFVGVMMLGTEMKARRGRRRATRRRTSVRTKTVYRSRGRSRRYRGTASPSIGLGDVAVMGFAAERFGVFDAIDKIIDSIVNILGGDEVSLDTIRADAKGILNSIRDKISLRSALEVGAAGGAVGFVRRIIPGASGTLWKVPKGIPGIGGMRIKRF